MSPDHGASFPRVTDRTPRRVSRAPALAAIALAVLLATAAVSGAHPAGRAQTFVWHALPRTAPVAGAAAIRRTTWLSRFRITEYFPAPEAWAVGRPVTTPGLPDKHRVDWLYGAFGMSMEGTGIGLDGRLYHIDSLGHGGWVARSGLATFDGMHDNGPPYWRAGGFWRNRRRGVTFPLLTGGWSSGAGVRYVPAPRGISFAPGAGTPGLRYWRTIAVDPSLIRFGSRVYIPYYRGVKGATGWFVANDTGGAIGGRHIDVYRAPPSNRDDSGRSLTGQRVLIVPPGGTIPKGVPRPPAANGDGTGSDASGGGHTPSGGTMPRASASSPTARTGAGGPLDLIGARLAQDGPSLRLLLRTRGSWGPRQLVPAQQRSLCVELFRGAGAAPRSRLCVLGRSDSTRAQLRFERLSPTGAVLATRTLTDVHRPDTRTVQANFTPAQVELPLGAYRWRATSSWTGPPECTAAPCTHQLPLRGTNHDTILPPRVAGCVPAGGSYRLNGPGHRKLVALTFDDGPSSYTPEVLGILRRFRIHATFFLIGEQVGPNAQLVRQELAAGHAVGDHTWDHSNVAGGGSFAYSQILRTRSAIRRASGYYTPCVFRAPYGAVSGGLIGVARSLGMLTIEWDVDPQDWARPGSDAIYSRIVGQTRRESIILMHDGGGPRNQTVTALPAVIRTLRSRGYGFVTVPELLGLKPVYG